MGCSLTNKSGSFMKNVELVVPTLVTAHARLHSHGRSLSLSLSHVRPPCDHHLLQSQVKILNFPWGSALNSWIKFKISNTTTTTNKTEGTICRYGGFIHTCINICGEKGTSNSSNLTWNVSHILLLILKKKL